jgi:hypothetical protein
MDRALPRPLDVPWRQVGIALYVGVNVGMMLFWNVFGDIDPADWDTWRAVPNGLRQGTLYNLGTELPFILSPLMAPVMATIGMLGMWLVGALQVATVFLLRSPLLIGLTLVSWGFWTGVLGGSAFGFVFVAGALAMRGSKSAALIYMALLFLMPRPVQMPLALYLLWHRPDLRWPTATIAMVNAVGVLLTGYADEWLAALSTLGVPAWNLGPAALIGTWWLVLGIPLGAVLLWRGHPGWAGLAWSTYWVPHYFLMPLVDLREANPVVGGGDRVSRAARIDAQPCGTDRHRRIDGAGYREP